MIEHPLSNPYENYTIQPICCCPACIREERRKTPHKCPVCLGSGRISDGRDSSTTVLQTVACHPCSGSGVIWG